MTYWLQELQQKRWEYCSGLDMVKGDSRASPTPGDFSKGLVARDNPGESREGDSRPFPAHSRWPWRGGLMQAPTQRSDHPFPTVAFRRFRVFPPTESYSSLRTTLGVGRGHAWLPMQSRGERDPVLPACAH